MNNSTTGDQVCPDCGGVWTYNHTCPLLYSTAPLLRFVPYTENIALTRIADALEKLVALLKKAEETE